MKRSHRGNPRQATLTPALTAWRRELARGARTVATFDALWRAACWEARGDEDARVTALAILREAA